MDKVVLYSRVSTFGQKIDRQGYDLHQYCNKNNLKVIKEFSEIVSGTKFSEKDRPGLTELIAFCSDKKNGVDGVVITEISRFNRILKDLLINIDTLTKLCIYVDAPSNNIKTLNADKSRNEQAFMYLAIYGSIAEMERNTTVSRSKSGLLNSAVNKKHFSGGKYLPYGYKKEDKKLIIDEQESEVITLIFNEHLHGNGTRKISNLLNSKGVKTRYTLIGNTIKIMGIDTKSTSYKWRDATIYGILTNPLYCGLRQYKETNSKKEVIKVHTIEQPELAIISKDVFDEVQKRLKFNSNKTGNNTKHKYILKGKLIECGYCENHGLRNHYFPHKRTATGQNVAKDNRYICISKRNGTKQSYNCENYGIGIDKLVNSIWYILRRQPDLKKRIRETSENLSIQEEIDKTLLKIEEKNEALKQVFSEEQILINLILEKKITDVSFDEFNDKIQRKRNNILNELIAFNKEYSEFSQIQKNSLDLEKDIDVISREIHNIKTSYSRIAEIINLMVKKITIYPVFEGYKMGTISNNKVVYVQLELFSSIFPFTYLISQRTETIQLLLRGEFNKEKYSVIRDSNQLTDRLKNIKFHIESI